MPHSFTNRKGTESSFAEILRFDSKGVIETRAIVLPCDAGCKVDQLGLIASCASLKVLCIRANNHRKLPQAWRSAGDPLVGASSLLDSVGSGAAHLFQQLLQKKLALFGAQLAL
jgi:hypothetical protein